MKQFSIQATRVLAIGGISCWADEMDPLHGYCAGSSQCIDNGTNSPRPIVRETILVLRSARAREREPFFSLF
jgi:hypothetical protein